MSLCLSSCLPVCQHSSESVSLSGFSSSLSTCLSCQLCRSALFPCFTFPYPKNTASFPFSSMLYPPTHTLCKAIFPPIPSTTAFCSCSSPTRANLNLCPSHSFSAPPVGLPLSALVTPHSAPKLCLCLLAHGLLELLRSERVVLVTQLADDLAVLVRDALEGWGSKVMERTESSDGCRARAAPQSHWRELKLV